MFRALVTLCLSTSYLFSQADLLQRYFEEGEKALAENRYADAEKAYEKLSQLDPGAAELHAKLGVIYFQQGKFAEVVPVLKQALKLKPGLPNADLLLAMSLSELERYTEALSGLEKGFRRTADPALKRMSGLQLQRSYTGLRRFSKASEIALELTRLYPEDPEILYHAGRVLANSAYLTTMKLAHVAPQSVWTHLAVAEATESQGVYDTAITQYRKVVEIEPSRPDIHFRLGRALLASSKRANAQGQELAEAIKAFEQELTLNPRNANATYELGEIYRTSGEFAKARVFFETALKHYPDFSEAELGMGRVLISLRQPDQALTHLRKAVSLDPKNDVPHYLLAQAYGLLNNKADQQKAIAEYQRLRADRSRQEDILLERTVTRQEAGTEQP